MDGWEIKRKRLGENGTFDPNRKTLFLYSSRGNQNLRSGLSSTEYPGHPRPVVVVETGVDRDDRGMGHTRRQKDLLRDKEPERWKTILQRTSRERRDSDRCRLTKRPGQEVGREISIHPLP